MTLSTKILLFLFGLLLLSGVGFIVYKQIEISHRQAAIENSFIQQKELADNIMRSLSKYSTKEDLESFAKSQNLNLDVIKKDLEGLNANLVAINSVIVTSKGQSGTGVPSTGTTPNPNPPVVNPENPDPFGYLSNRQEFELNESFENVSVPFGKVGFSAWKDKPWDYNIAPRDYHLTNTIGTDENQRHYIYNKFSVKVGDKIYDLKIGSSQTVEEYPASKFSFWNPRIYLGMDGGMRIGTSTNFIHGEASPNVNVGIMSYGRYKNLPDISVLQIGAGFGVDAQKFNLSLTPIMYNVGKHIPLMSNFYVGPSININTSGDIGVMGGIRVGL
jgi:hypothetical protein